MATLASDVRIRVLRIALAEASFAKRGFIAASECARDRLEMIGRIFVGGYNDAIHTGDAAAVVPRLESATAEFRGFAYEGAAMAFYLLDTLMPWSPSRFTAFVNGAAAGHVYMAHVGAGWCLARMPRKYSMLPRRLDPLLGWLSFDGFGFHQGYFHEPRVIGRQLPDRRLRGYAARAFDQGLGRSLWFSRGCDVPAIAGAIRAFDTHRQEDLWSGVGLACVYAGGADRGSIEDLIDVAGPHRGALAQGGAFAAAARHRAETPSPESTLACHLVVGMAPDAAAALTDRTLHEIDVAIPIHMRYDAWRTRLRHALQ